MVRGSNPGGGEIFRTCPDWPWGPPSLPYNGYQFIPRGKWPGHVADHPPPYNTEVKERIELYLYSTSGPSWPVIGCTLPLPLSLRQKAYKYILTVLEPVISSTRRTYKIQGIYHI